MGHSELNLIGVFVISLSVRRQQDAGAVNFKTNRHFEDRQRFRSGLFSGCTGKAKIPHCGAANLSTLCARRHSALMPVNLGRRNGAEAGVLAPDSWRIRQSAPDQMGPRRVHGLMGMAAVVQSYCWECFVSARRGPNCIALHASPKHQDVIK
jgi:hypothetical protein